MRGVTSSRAASDALVAALENQAADTAASNAARLATLVDFWKDVDDASAILASIRPAAPPPLPEDPWYASRDGTQDAVLVTGHESDLNNLFFDFNDDHPDGEHLREETPPPPPPPPRTTDVSDVARALRAANDFANVFGHFESLGDMNDDGRFQPNRGKVTTWRLELTGYRKCSDRLTSKAADALLTAIEDAAPKHLVTTRRVSGAAAAAAAAAAAL